MLLGELILAVGGTIKRPDLADSIAFKTIQAVRVLHMRAFFQKNISEFTVASGAITYATADQNVGTFDLPKDCRQPIIVQGVAPDGSFLESTFKKTSLTELTKLRMTNRDNYTYYMVGSKLSFKAPARVSTVVVAAAIYRPEYGVLHLPSGQQRPVTDPVILQYTDWLLENYPAAVQDYAIAYVAAAIGDTELGNFFTSRFAQMQSPVLDLEPAIVVP